MGMKKYMGVIIDKKWWYRTKTCYPFFRVLSPFPRFIPFSAFYPFFRVLSLFPRFIPFSAFYPFFRVLSLFPRFIPFSASTIPYFRNSGSVFYPNPLWFQCATPTFTPAQAFKAPSIFCLKHMVDFLVRRFGTLFFRVALVTAIACL